MINPIAFLVQATLELPARPLQRHRIDITGLGLCKGEWEDVDDSQIKNPTEKDRYRFVLQEIGWLTKINPDRYEYRLKPEKANETNDNRGAN